MNKHYILIKKNDKKKIRSFKNKRKHLKFYPKNQIKYKGIKVKQVNVYDDKFNETILKRKCKRKFEQYLNYIINFIDDTDDSDGITDLRHALNDLTRYKNIILHKYQQYLDKRYVELLLKKISLLEYEINHKLMYLETYQYYQKQMYEDLYSYEEKGKSR